MWWIQSGDYDEILVDSHSHTQISFLLPYLVVNVSRSQLLYNSLVNVDIQKDQLISQAVQERLLLAPHLCCHSSKEGDSPSHLIFLTSDLMRQQPFSSEEGPAKSKLCPLPHSSHSTFDLYRRQKCHESMSWQFCSAHVTILGILMKINSIKDWLFVDV